MSSALTALITIFLYILWRSRTMRSLPALRRVEIWSEPLQPPKTRAQKCAICFTLPRGFPQAPPTSHCAHDVSTCRTCLSTHIEYHLRSKGVEGITCPTPRCNAGLSPTDIARWASPKVTQRYERLITLQALRGRPVFYCVKAGCDAFQEHEGEEEYPIVTCYKCKSKACYTHRVTWHEGVTCSQYDVSTPLNHRKDDAATQKVVDQYKKCPQCTISIDKDDSCDHVKCAACRHEFCFVCLAPHKQILLSGNHHHKPHCRHYRAWDGQPTPVIAPTPPPPHTPRLAVGPGKAQAFRAKLKKLCRRA